jgi:peroxiredoxin Q/BCP
MLQPGQLAPEFALRDESGELLSLAELLSNGPLIVFFYPADFTPICTREACMLRDMHDELHQLGFRVVGISADESDRHASFKRKHDLPYTLLSDPEKDVTRLYLADGPLGLGTRRVTYLIGQDGYIADAVVADVRLSRHRTFVQKAMATAMTAAEARV